jgi:hypothetical protein
MARFVNRFIHGHLPTRYHCCSMGSASTDHCPLCQQLETQDHLYLCPQQHQWRADFLDQLTQHLTATQTEPMLQTAVCETLTDWLEDVRPRRHPTAITQHQHAIGFHLLHRGYICTEWTRRRIPMNPTWATHGHVTSSPSYGIPPTNSGPYETPPYTVLTTPSHATMTSKLQQSNSMRCKTNHSPKTGTTSTSHSLNDSHNHHIAYPTTSKPKHPSSCTASPKHSNEQPASPTHHQLLHPCQRRMNLN